MAASVQICCHVLAEEETHNVLSSGAFDGQASRQTVLVLLN